MAFFTDHETLPSYAERMAVPGTWGENLTLLIMAEILQTPICVAQTHGVQTITPSSCIGQPIWIAYDGSCHYDCVFPAGIDLHNSSPPVLHHDLNSSRDQQASQEDGPQISKESSSWSLVTANINSFSAQQDVLLDIPFDIATLQETRHTARSQHGFSLFLKKAGYNVIWGKPQPFRTAKSAYHTSSGLNGRPGGVAILTRKHIPLQFIPPGTCPIRKRLYHSSRWIHGTVPFGNCKQVFHIFSIYGFTGAYSNAQSADFNESFLQDVVDVVHALGPDAPVLICGDINIEPDSSPVLKAALAAGIIFDMCLHSGPTFFPSHGRPRKLDVILATRSAAVCLQASHTMDNSGIPGHLPVAVVLNFPILSELTLRLRKPASFPNKIAVQPDLAQEILKKHPKPDALDVNSLYDHFSKVAEKYFMSATNLPQKKFAGRGLTPKLHLEQRFCPQGKHGIGCESTFLRRAKRLLRRLEQLQHLYNNHFAISWKASHLWDIIAAQSKFLYNLSHISISKERPSDVQLDALIKDVHDTVRNVQANEISQRVRAAQVKLQQNWKDSPATVYAKIDPEIISPTFVLQKPDGDYTGNSVEFSQLLFDAWLPIFDKYSSESEPSWDAFSQRFGAYFSSPVHMNLRPFTSHGLRSILNKMKVRSACGPDFWSVADLKNLPDTIFDLLPNIFSSIESNACWPESMMFAFRTLIPKESGDCTPLGQRPLGVMSVLYRLYAAFRLQDVIAWQEALLHSSQFGFRPGVLLMTFLIQFLCKSNKHY